MMISQKDAIEKRMPSENECEEMNNKYGKLEESIEYAFRDRSILLHALTHTSYANENRMGKSGSNERLEFLGDAVLELAVSEYLFEINKEKQEGDLSKTRARLVCEAALANHAEKLNLGEYILMGKGEESTGGRSRASIISDALEALIGAIYLDGGFTKAKEFILKFILKDAQSSIFFFDSKTILQEEVQKEKKTLSYIVLSESGPDHQKEFRVAACIDNKEVGYGAGRGKKSAEQEAAYDALKKLGKVKD